MVFRGELSGRTALVSVKDTSVSLALGHDWVAVWDTGGRLYSLWKDGHTYRRGLDGRFLHKWRRNLPREAGQPARSPYDSRERAHIAGAEADGLVQEAAEACRRALASIDAAPDAWSGRDGERPDGTVVDLARRCARFDAAAAGQDAVRFATVLSPVGVLPPDQYLSIVLQGTEGCSFGNCAFCDLYDQPYRVKSADEFARHIAAVREFLGESARLRSRALFLGAANALAVPMRRLVEFLQAAAESFGPASPPVHAFVDGFTGLQKAPSDYAVLRRNGLRRVYVGLESGHDPLLELVKKPSTRREAVDTVRAIKAGGLSAGVIVMVGLGGRRFAAAHAADTIVAVNEMELGAGDRLFFSDLVVVPGTEYPRLDISARLGALTLSERLAQMEAIRSGLRFAGAPPQVARYDVREFVY